MHWEVFENPLGGFWKNLARIFEKPRDFFIFAYCTKILINGRFSIVESPLKRSVLDIISKKKGEKPKIKV